MGRIIEPAKSGIDAVVLLDGIELGGQRAATLNQTMSVINVTNNITGEWVRNITGVKSWDLTCSGFVIKNADALVALQNAFTNGDILTIKFMDGDIHFEGTAFLTSLPYNERYNDSCTYSLKFTGTGEIIIPSGQE